MPLFRVLPRDDHLQLDSSYPYGQLESNIHILSWLGEWETPLEVFESLKNKLAPSLDGASDNQ